MSEDLTPRQPDRLDQLIALVQSMDARLERIEATQAAFETRLSAFETRLSAIETRLSAIEDRLAPTNQLPRIYAEVQEISIKLDKLSRSHMSVVQLLGELTGKAGEIEDRVKELEKK